MNHFIRYINCVQSIRYDKFLSFRGIKLLISQFVEKFVATITELESPDGHFGRLRAPIVLENIIKDSKKTERKIKDVRLQEKARQL